MASISGRVCADRQRFVRFSLKTCGEKGGYFANPRQNGRNRLTTGRAKWLVRNPTQLA